MGVLIETESGATYELGGGRIRRLERGSNNAKRRDGEWVKVHRIYPDVLTVGLPMILELESLAAYGPDDHGTTDPHPTVTTRTTTPIKSIQETP